MANNLVTQSLKILGKAVKDTGKEYTSNLTAFFNDAKDVKNSITNSATDVADTYAKLKRTNITKAIHDWFYQEESDSEASIGTGDEFDAGMGSSSGEAKLDGESSVTALTAESMINIANKQTNAMIKIGRRQTEQSVANTAEIVSSLNSRSAEMLTAVNNINKTLVGISSRLDKIIELQAVPLTNKQEEIDKGGLYQDGKLSLMRIFEQSKNSVMNTGPMSLITMGFDMLRSGQLGPSGVAKLGIEKLAQKITVNGKSFDDWGKAFNEMIGTATQTAMNEMINSNTFRRMFPGLTSLNERDKDYGTVVPNLYDNKRAIFDGMTRMSIVNIIPEMLAKINQSISGQEYHLNERGKWIAGPIKNEFNEVTRASFASGGLSNKMTNQISNAGVQSIGKKIPADDIKLASEALTMAIVIKLHEDGVRSFSASRIKTELGAQVGRAAAVLGLMGKGSEEYWEKVCTTIVMQLSTGMMNAAGFVSNVNQSLQKMITDATNFAQNGKPTASQASKITFDMAANQFLATKGAPTNTPAVQSVTNNNGTLASSKGEIVNVHEKVGKFSTNQYVGGIFYLLNRGINVRVTKGKAWDPITLQQIRPESTPYVTDNTFGELISKGLAGKKSDFDKVAKSVVTGDDRKGFLSKLLDNPASALMALSNFVRGGGGGGFFAGIKDKAKGFLGEENYNAIADKLGGIKDNIQQRIEGDDRFKAAQEKVKAKFEELRGKAADKLDQLGHNRIINNTLYARDNLRLKSANDTLDHFSSDDELDNTRAAGIRGLLNEGRFDLAEKYLERIKNPTLKKALSDVTEINKKRKEGEEAQANGQQADIGSVLITRPGEEDDGKVSKDESQRSILGRMLGMVGKIAKGVAKLTARGALDLTMGLKSMAQGLITGYKDVDAEGNEHYNKGLIRNLTTVPMGALAKGAGKVAKAGVNKVKEVFSGEGLVSKAIKGIRGVLNKMLDKLGSIAGTLKDKIAGVLGKIKNSSFGQKVGKGLSKLGDNKFMRGFTSGFKDAKAARDKLLNKKKVDEARSENPLQADQVDMFEGKKESIFTKMHGLLEGIFGSVKKQEEISEEEAKKEDKKEDGTPQGSPDIDTVTSSRQGGDTGGNSGGDSEGGGGKGGGILSGIKSVIGDIMGNFGKMLGGMTQALLGIGEMVIGIVTSLESFSALKDMVQSILVDGLQPLNEAFDAIMEAIKPLVDTLKGMVSTIAKVVVNIAKSLIDVVQPIIEAIQPIIQTIIDLLSPILKIIEVLMNVIMIPIKIALDIISPVIEGIGYTLQVVSGVLQIGLGAVLGLLGGVVSGLGLILSAIGSIPLIPGDGIKKSGESLKATGKDMLEMSKTMMSAGAEQIKQGIQGGIALIQRLIPGGEDGTTEEKTESKPTDNRKAELTNDFGSGDVTNINNSYSYTYGSGNTTMNQHSYGNYMNMSDRGCGPVALADAYGRRGGGNVNPALLAASMNGAGTYDPRRGTSVSSMIATGNAMGMGMRAGGVTAASLSMASPSNPITVLGSGQGFGTRSGNNHYVNVVGTDGHGGAYVSNPMTGRVGRESASNIVLNSKLGLYGSGDNEYEEYGISDAAADSLSRLKDITSRLTTMFTGEDDATKKINDANAEQKAKEIKRTLGDDYDAVEQQAIAALKAKYPDYTDAQIQNKLNSREGWNLIQKYGGQKAADLYTDAQNLIKKGGEEIGENLTNIASKLDAISISTDDLEGSSVSGATMASFEPILHKVADFPQDGSGQYDQSPVHDFFNATKIEGKDNWRVGGGKGIVYSSSRGGWYNKYKDPHTTEGEGTSGDSHEGVLLRYTGDGTALAKAITGGTVTYVTRGEEGETTGLGNAVKWRDSGGMYHWYLHMNSLDKDIQEGTNLEPGQLIGYFGNSGMNSDGKYLRYIVTSAGPQGNTGDPGHMNPFTFWQFREEADLSTGDTEEKTYKYLVSKGMSPIGAAGMMGCFKHESNFQYDNLENVYQDMMGYPAGQAGDAQYAADVDSKKESRDQFITGRNLTAYSGQTPGAAVGFGIAQFTSQNLKSSLYDNTVGQGKSITDIPGQLDEVLNTLQARGIYDQIKGAATPTDANKIFLWKYEAGTGYTSDEQVLGDYPWMLQSNPNGVIARHNSAEEYYKKYKDLNVVQGSAGGTGGGKFIAIATNPDAFVSKDGYFSSDGGAVLADYGIPTITSTNIDGNTSGNAPLYEFFTKTGGVGNAYSANENWYLKRLNPNREGVGSQHSSLGEHGGIDVNWDSGSDGRELHATTHGTVDAVTTTGSAGNSIRWLDDAGYLHWYMHMKDTPLLGEKQEVKPGQLLGYVGNTGDSGGSHLHYSIIQADQFNGYSNSPGGVNPLMYFGHYNSAGPQTNPNERGGLTFLTGIHGASESGKQVQAIQEAGGMAAYVSSLIGNNTTTTKEQEAKAAFDIWNAVNYKKAGHDRNEALKLLVSYYNQVTDPSAKSYYNDAFNANHGRDYFDFANGKTMQVSDLNNMLVRYIQGEDNAFPTFLADLKSAAHPIIVSSNTSSGSSGGGGHVRGSGDVPSSWYDMITNASSNISAVDIPPIDESKLTDSTSFTALQNMANKFNIKPDDTKTTDMLNRMSQMTFNVRAERVEELLEVLIAKVDGRNNVSTDQPLPYVFDDGIPEPVTRLSLG